MHAGMMRRSAERQSARGGGGKTKNEGEREASRGLERACKRGGKERIRAEPRFTLALDSPHARSRCSARPPG